MACRCARRVAIMLGRIREFHPTMMRTAMSDPKKQEQDAAANWKALQAELGLVSEDPEPRSPSPAREEPAARPSAPEPQASMWGSEPRPAAEPLPTESPFLEGLIPAGANADDNMNVPVLEQAEGEAGSEHEVEVGEAPEESPETEVESEEEKRPRRRRGRRRRRPDGSSPREEAAEEREGSAAPAADEEDAEDGGDEADEPAGEDEVEAEPFVDWNVPSWQELIGSLYRPER